MYLCVCVHVCACMPTVPTELPPQPIKCILFHAQCNVDKVSCDYSTASSHLLRGGSGQVPVLQTPTLPSEAAVGGAGDGFL